MAEGGEGVDLGPVADPGLAGDHDMRMQGDAVAEDDTLADEAERPDRNVRAESCLRRDDRSRMNGLRHRTYSATSIAEMVASAARAPSTIASPRYHHMFRRLLSFVMCRRTWSPGITGFLNLHSSIVMK
jgi:hypothetical protein